MNGANDGFAFLGQSSHGLHDGDGHERVQATRGLVGEQKSRVSHDLGRERQAPLLAPRYAFAPEQPNHILLALVQIQLLNDLVDSLDPVLLWRARLHAQHRLEEQVLPHRQIPVIKENSNK